MKLPTGSIPIDFTYVVHTNIDNIYVKEIK
ncbi:MAG: hypothetical protein ACTS89_02525 [Arsenophonus sp. ER-LPS3-MAG3]